MWVGLYCSANSDFKVFTARKTKKINNVRSSFSSYSRTVARTVTKSWPINDQGIVELLTHNEDVNLAGN